jgi:REP element-mobilizing transposase RayT
MPRQPRRDAPGVVHHVWARGIDGRAIFLDDADRTDLLERFARVLPESGMRCFGFALMSNHAHFALRTGAVPLSTVMKRIHTGFAVRFNRRSERRGYLFQGRFGSRVVKDDGDLLAVIAYVLRNPLEAGLARSLRDLERYPWCSYGALLGSREPLAFESVSATLAAFAPDPEAARERLRAWVARDPAPERRPPSLDELIRVVSREHGVAEADLRAGVRSHAVSLARARLCRRAVSELAMTPAALARALGLAHSSVSQALRKNDG